jgi:hypothetical protein
MILLRTTGTLSPFLPYWALSTIILGVPKRMVGFQIRIYVFRISYHVQS